MFLGYDAWQVVSVAILLGLFILLVLRPYHGHRKRRSCGLHRWFYDGGIHRCEYCGFSTGKEFTSVFLRYASPKLISRTFTGIWFSFLAIFDKRRKKYQTRLKRRFKRLVADEAGSFWRRLSALAIALKYDWYILVRYLMRFSERPRDKILVYTCNSKRCRFGDPAFRVICQDGIELHVCYRHHPRRGSGLKKIFVQGKEFDIESALVRIEYLKHRWWILKNRIISRREYKKDHCQRPGCYNRARFMILSEGGKLRICINEHPGSNKDREASRWIEGQIGKDYTIRTKNKSELRDGRLAVIKERRDKFKFIDNAFFAAHLDMEIKYGFMCDFPNCPQISNWMYLDDGRIEARKDYTSPRFFSLENIHSLFKKNQIDESQVILKVCERHKYEDNPWVRYRLKERDWFEIRAELLKLEKTVLDAKDITDVLNEK